MEFVDENLLLFMMKSDWWGENILHETCARKTIIQKKLDKKYKEEEDVKAWVEINFENKKTKRGGCQTYL